MNTVISQFDVATYKRLSIPAVLSGASALIFEILFARTLSLIFGSTMEAASVTFASFLFGLAVGAYLAGKVCYRIKNVLNFYTLIEIFCGLVSLLIFFILFYYSTWFNQLPNTGLERIISYFCFGFLLILPATVLMGMTFPTMVEILIRTQQPHEDIGGIYSANLFGAAIGILLGFVSIFVLGMIGAACIAAGFNFLAGIIVYLEKKHINVTSHDMDLSVSKPLREIFLYAICFASGFIIIAIELVWLRFSSFFLGNRIYAFAMTLFIAMFSMMLGSRIAKILYNNDKIGNKDKLCLIICAAITLLAFSAIFTWWWIQHQSTIELILPGFKHFGSGYRIIESIILLAPLFTLVGIIFPYAMLVASKNQAKTTLICSELYLVNGIGAALACLLIGMISLEYIGTFHSINLVLFILILCLVYQYKFNIGLVKTLVLSAISILSILLLQYLKPYDLSLLNNGESLRFIAEDRYGIFQISELENKKKRVVLNNTSLVYYAGDRRTDYVQQMQAHLGVWFNPDAKNVAVLGSGYGITAGIFALYPLIKHVDAVEILPNIIKAAPIFSNENNNYHLNNKVEIYQNDGRNFLYSTDKKYDIVSINVSDPQLPGGASLFHQDFYKAVQEKLTDNGVIVTHIFGYQRKILFATLKSVFRYVALFPAYKNGFNVVASNHQLEIDWSTVKPMITTPDLNEQLNKIGFIHPISPVMLNWLTEKDLPKKYLNAKIATDNYPRVEFNLSALNGNAIFFSNE